MIVVFIQAFVFSVIGTLLLSPVVGLIVDMKDKDKRNKSCIITMVLLMFVFIYVFSVN